MIDTDFAAILYRARQIRGWEHGTCQLQAGGKSSDCWCWHTGPNGSNINCPPPPEPPVTAALVPDFHLPDMPVPWFPI